jgi:drug/metabolite transporter (DMT)-like permease
MSATPPQNIKNHAAMQHPLLPVFFILLGMLWLPCLDAIVKGLTGLATVAMLSFGRNFTQAVLMLPAAWRDSRGTLWPLPHAWLHALRGFFMVSSGMLFFAGVQRLPLADNMALGFTYPFLVASLAPLLLKEKSDIWQALAILSGFIGALIIIRPGSGIFGVAALLPLASTIGYAGYVLTTRKLAQQDAPISVLQFWMGVFGSLWVLPVFGVAAIMHWPQLQWQAISGTAALGIFGMGVIGTTGHWLVTTGARHVSASVQAGLGYTEIITATLLGWVFWHDFPDHWTWVGIAVIIGSGIWLIQLERRAG